MVAPGPAHGPVAGNGFLPILDPLIIGRVDRAPRRRAKDRPVETIFLAGPRNRVRNGESLDPQETGNIGEAAVEHDRSVGLRLVPRRQLRREHCIGEGERILFAQRHAACRSEDRTRDFLDRGHAAARKLGQQRGLARPGSPRDGGSLDGHRARTLTGSSSRRSLRWSWNPSSCRAGIPSRRSSPSA